jgi:hypothetical protein
MRRIEMTESQRQEKRSGLVDKWNKVVLCNKPSAKQIRAKKRAIQHMRRDRRDIVADQDMYIKETIKQEKEMREYKA